jgi:hypothetical protein
VAEAAGTLEQATAEGAQITTGTPIGYLVRDPAEGLDV